MNPKLDEDRMIPGLRHPVRTDSGFYIFGRDGTRIIQESDLVQLSHVCAYENGHWKKTRYRGIPVLKTPNDLFLLQDVIWETRPDLIIETGTYYGGSALWMAQVLDGLGRGRILTVDKWNEAERPVHSRIEYHFGDSTGEKFQKAIEVYLPHALSVMVVLDSDHRAAHVYKELTLFSTYVSEGQYLIVEDGNLNGHPVNPEYGPGPAEALEEWLPSEQGKCFENQITVETKYGYSFFPGGWLRRIRNSE